MAEQQLSWVPANIDLTRPNAARIYDYVLGGANNFGVDREFAKRLMAAVPDAPEQAHQNRSFLRRAVAYLTERGIRQFLDLGSGIPTVGNTHEVAQRIAPAARVLYVDNEAVAVAHSELILQGNPNADILRADITDPDFVLAHPRTRALLDFDQPIGVLMFASMHFVPDEADPAALVGRYRDATAPGSYLAMSHGTADNRPEVTSAVSEYQQTANPVFLRTRPEVIRLFEGYELVEPGVVSGAVWRPEVSSPDGEQVSLIWGAVGRRP
jgi:SAM-dependent methyltransferase